MKTYYDWIEYNSQRNNDAIRIYNYNLKSKANYLAISKFKLIYA